MYHRLAGKRSLLGASSHIQASFSRQKNTSKIEIVREIGKINEYARRIRELRDEEDFQIKSHVDRADLKPNECILETLERKPVISRTISPQLGIEILERNGFTCQLCGADPGDADPFNSNRKVRLHIDHIKPISQGGTDNKNNLRVLCSACNQDKANVQPPSNTAINIIAKIRKLQIEK